ncbi:MAG: hypothetical protein ACOCUR_01345 [Nanoarchaeota archaeon]
MAISRREILGNELMKEIVSIRIETLWKMIYLREENMLPGVLEEGATSEHDNKGAMFLPGGFIPKDSDEMTPKVTLYQDKSPETFRQYVKASMQLDNATLLYHDGIATGVNLDNGFFSRLARNILENKQAAFKRSTLLKEQVPPRATSEDIVRSHCPGYIAPPYGSRTKLSSCISICMSQPRMYFQQMREKFNPDSELEKNIWHSIRTSRKPIIGDNGKPLAPPYMVVCYSTRYKPEIMTGITRILGLSKFGEFATITLEEVTSNLMNKMEGRRKPRKEEIIAKHKDKEYVGVFRTYPSTTYGKRLQTRPTIYTSLISPKKDMDINLEEITEKYHEKYNLKNGNQ